MAQKVLIAEDEAFIAFDLCETVEEAGYEVEGPHAGISSAMLAFQKEKPDLAILDVRLDDGEVYPLARKLEQDNVPLPGSDCSEEALPANANAPGGERGSFEPGSARLILASGHD